MNSRPDLSIILHSICQNVYYQPPESLKLTYPAIIYSRSEIQNGFADNVVYKQNHRYKVIVVDKNPDSSIVEAVSKIPGCSYGTHYISDGLNHDAFFIYY